MCRLADALRTSSLPSPPGPLPSGCLRDVAARLIVGRRGSRAIVKVLAALAGLEHLDLTVYMASGRHMRSDWYQAPPRVQFNWPNLQGGAVALVPQLKAAQLPSLQSLTLETVGEAALQYLDRGLDHSKGIWGVPWVFQLTRLEIKALCHCQAGTEALHVLRSGAALPPLPLLHELSIASKELSNRDADALVAAQLPALRALKVGGLSSGRAMDLMEAGWFAALESLELKLSMAWNYIVSMALGRVPFSGLTRLAVAGAEPCATRVTSTLLSSHALFERLRALDLGLPLRVAPAPGVDDADDADISIDDPFELVVNEIRMPHLESLTLSRLPNLGRRRGASCQSALAAQPRRAQAL